MTKAIFEYTFADWKRLRPITHRYKTARYQGIDRRYRAKPAAFGDVGAVARMIAGRKALFTIAFEDAEAIGWQAILLRHFVPDALHVVVDNSSAHAQAKLIERTAGEHGAAYLRTPPNPWRSGSRSHGIVLNWVWHNVVLAGMPTAFGFLDDDLFPTAPDDPFAPLARQDVYGVRRPGGTRWFLWAGFTMMRFAAVRDRQLDFGQDWFAGLDTGGGNWEPLYRHLDEAALDFVPTRFVPYREGVALEQGQMQWCGAWLHEIGQAGQQELMADKRRVVARILEPHLYAARTALVG